MGKCRRCGIEFEDLTEQEEDLCDACLEELSHEDEFEDEETIVDDPDFSCFDVSMDETE